MKKHKHANEIKAWADGLEIEMKVFMAGKDDLWITIDHPEWHESVQYRVKKEKKVLKQHVYMEIGNCKFKSFPSDKANLLVTFDYDTHKLIKVEIL